MHVKTMTLALICALQSAHAGAAAPNDELAAPIHQFVDSLAKGDVAGAQAAYASTSLAITDEVPPYHWQGTGAFDAWAADLAKFETASGNTDARLVLGDAIREEATGDDAYVVMVATYTYKARGVPVREDARMTFVLHKEAGGWRIQSWTFASPKAVAAMP